MTAMTGILRLMMAFVPALLLVMAGVGPAMSAELIIYESEGCEWCEAWDKEVGVIYAKTDEGKRLPLRRVDADEDLPQDLADINGLVYTPTFLVMDQGREIGRIIGYPGEDFFWGLLSGIIAKLEAGPATGN